MLAPVKFLTLAATIVGFEAPTTFFVASVFLAYRASSVLVHVCTRPFAREYLVDVVVGVADREHGGFAFTGLVSSCKNMLLCIASPSC